MANLKSAMISLIATKGTKKFYFAYGAGKRKDNKCDGEFAVAPGKIKKSEIEGALVASKDVIEGTCWVGVGAEDKGTVYFKGNGKKLSGMVVSKMALTAKTLTGGIVYDFQIPPPEEEARADKLGGDSDGAAEATPEKKDGAAKPEGAAKPTDLKGRLATLKKRTDEVFAKTPEARKSKLLPIYQLAEHLVNGGKDKAPEALDKLEKALDTIGPDGKLPEEGGKPAPTSTVPPTPEAALAAFQQRLKALQPDYEKAIATNTEAGKEAKLRMSEAKLFGERKKDYAQAKTLLDEVEEQVKLALGSGKPEGSTGEKKATGEGKKETTGEKKATGEGKKEPIAETPVDPEEKKFRAEYDRLKPDIDRGVNFRKLNNETMELKTAFVQSYKKVQFAEKGKDWIPGQEMLKDVEKKLAAFFKAAGEAEIGKGPKPIPKPPSGGPPKTGAPRPKPESTESTKDSTDEKEAAERAAELLKEYKKRATAWLPEIKAATAKGPNANAINKRLAQSTSLAKPGGDIEQALEKLTEAYMLAGGDPEAEIEDGEPKEKGEDKPAKPSGTEKEPKKTEEQGSTTTTDTKPKTTEEQGSKKTPDPKTKTTEEQGAEPTSPKETGAEPSKAEGPAAEPAKSKEKKPETFEGRLSEASDASRKSIEKLPSNDYVRGLLLNWLEFHLRNIKAAGGQVGNEMVPLKLITDLGKQADDRVALTEKAEKIQKAVDKLDLQNPFRYNLQLRLGGARAMWNPANVPQSHAVLDMIQKGAETATGLEPKKGDKEEPEPEKDQAVEEDNRVEPEEIQEAENELEVVDEGGEEAPEPTEEPEKPGSESPATGPTKKVNLDKLNINQVKSAMVDFRIVGKKFLSRLPESARTEMAEINQMTSAGGHLVDAVKELKHALKKGKRDRAQKYSTKAHEALEQLETGASTLDSSMMTNAFEDGKKGREIKKDYKKAMKWYMDGHGRGGLLACINKVRGTLQIEDEGPKEG